MLRRISIGFALALLVALPAAAQDFEQGMAAADIGDYATALQEWRPLAAKGHASAQYNIGFLYEEGRGVPLDPVAAAKWYRKAAERGHGAAQRSLGLKYELGLGVPQDNVLAHMWYNLAAAGGDKFSVKARDDIAKRMTSAQIAKAQKLVRTWMAKHKKK
jgi:TPR repeat protein